MLLTKCEMLRDCVLCGIPLGKRDPQIQIVRNSPGGSYLGGVCVGHIITGNIKNKQYSEREERKIDLICATAVEYREAGMGHLEAVEAAKKLYGWKG